VIYGTVNAWPEATVELAVRGPEGREERLEFLVDTGFDGDLTLHSAVVAELGLQKVGESSAILADGSATSFGMCSAAVSWAGAPRKVSIQIADTIALLGMLERQELRIEVVPDGAVRITPLAQNTA
jgi:clan AA aspartic protease